MNNENFDLPKTATVKVIASSFYYVHIKKVTKDFNVETDHKPQWFFDEFLSKCRFESSKHNEENWSHDVYFPTLNYSQPIDVDLGLTVCFSPKTKKIIIIPTHTKILSGMKYEGFDEMCKETTNLDEYYINDKIVVL